MIRIRPFCALVILSICFNTNAIRVVSFSERDVDFIYQKHTTGASIPENELNKSFARESLGYSEISEVRNQLIINALVFTLYKPENQKQSYISVYNGFDGSSKMHGLFAN